MLEWATMSSSSGRRRWLAAVAIGIAGGAHAAPAAADDEMSRDVHTYFRGELDLASVACGLAAGSGYLGGVLLARATDASRAAAVPILTVGLAEAAIGIGLLVRTGPQVRALEEQLARAPKAYAAEEGARMERVLSNFVIFRSIEAVLLVTGAGTAALGAVLEEDRALGAGLGVASQAAIVLTLDAIAEARAERYLDAIHDFAAAPTISMAQGDTSYGLSLGGRF
jgi:hypothetical protein